MTQTTQFPRESSQNTRIYAASRSGNFSEAVTPRKGNVLYFPERTATECSADGASDIDSFIAELTSNDPSFSQSLKAARKTFGQELYDGEISLKTLRLKKGLSQADLAKAIGTSQSHIARIEKRPETIMLKTGVKLSAALGVDISLVAALADGAKIEA